MKSTVSTDVDDLNNVIELMAKNISSYTKNKSDFTRNRKLNCAAVLKVILNMKGNTLNAELLDAFPNVDNRMTAAAFERAKAKLCPKIFEDMLKAFNQTEKHKKLLDGKYRVYAIDGSSFYTPFNPSSELLVTKTGNTRIESYCMVHAHILYDLTNGVYQDCILEPRSIEDERDAAIEMVKRIDKSTPFIVIMDRGYDGLNMIETLNRMDNCYYIIRTKVDKRALTEIGNLPDEICDTEITFRVTTSYQYHRKNKQDKLVHLIPINETCHGKPTSRRWDFEEVCDVKCRVVKVRINDEDSGKEEWEVLLTNLPSSAFPVKRMKKMYHMRWGIETSFRHLKYALGAVNFHSKKDDFIKMELLAHLIMFNAVSRAVAIHNVIDIRKRKHLYVQDFTMACLIVRKYFALHCSEPPENMFREIELYSHRVRRGRKSVRGTIKSKAAKPFGYRVA